MGSDNMTFSPNNILNWIIRSEIKQYLYNPGACFSQVVVVRSHQKFKKQYAKNEQRECQSWYLRTGIWIGLISSFFFFYLLFIDPRQSAQDNQKKRVIVTLTSITDTAKGKLLSTHIHTYNTKEKHKPKKRQTFVKNK